MTVFGPPPWSGVTTHSARPSPLRSPAATNAPPVKSPPNGSVAGTSTVVPSRPSITAKRTGVPGPVASTRSGVPSAFTSALVERTFAGTPPNGLRVRPGLDPNRPPAGRYATAVPFSGRREGVIDDWEDRDLVVVADRGGVRVAPRIDRRPGRDAGDESPGWADAGDRDRVVRPTPGDARHRGAADGAAGEAHVRGVEPGH